MLLEFRIFQDPEELPEKPEMDQDNSYSQNWQCIKAFKWREQRSEKHPPGLNRDLTADGLQITCSQEASLYTFYYSWIYHHMNNLGNLT